MVRVKMVIIPDAAGCLAACNVSNLIYNVREIRAKENIVRASVTREYQDGVSGQDPHTGFRRTSTGRRRRSVVFVTRRGTGQSTLYSSTKGALGSARIHYLPPCLLSSESQSCIQDDYRRRRLLCKTKRDRLRCKIHSPAERERSTRPLLMGDVRDPSYA